MQGLSHFFSFILKERRAGVRIEKMEHRHRELNARTLS